MPAMVAIRRHYAGQAGSARREGCDSFRSSHVTLPPLEAFRDQPVRHDGGDCCAVLLEHHVVAVAVDTDLGELDPVVLHAGDGE